MYGQCLETDEFSKLPHSDPPKLDLFPCSLEILTNAALFVEKYLVTLGPQKTPVAPFTVRAGNMGRNKAPYEKVPDSVA